MHARCNAVSMLSSHVRTAASRRVLPATSIHVREAVEALKQDKILAVPTDTLYGLAASVSSELSVQSLYSAKMRSANMPLAICVSKVEDIDRYAHANHLCNGLLEELLPGPVTVLLNRKKSASISGMLNPGFELLSVLNQYGHAVALTSANLSGHQSTISIHEFYDMWEKCAWVFDSGKISASRLGSSIVDLSIPGEFILERKGDHVQGLQEILQSYGLEDKTQHAN